MANKYFVKTNEDRSGKEQYAMEIPDFKAVSDYYERADHSKDPQIPLRECFKKTLANTRKGLKW